MWYYDIPTNERKLLHEEKIIQGCLRKFYTVIFIMNFPITLFDSILQTNIKIWYNIKKN